MKPLHNVLSLLLAGALAGCGNQSTSSPSPASPSPSAATPAAAADKPSVPAAATAATRLDSNEPHYYLDHAQPKLSTVQLRIGTRTMDAELCTTLQQVATGLMFRPGIGTNDGMLFVFGTGSRRSFYMRNVDFDINAAYIDTEGIIREIVTLKKRDEAPVPSAADNIQFVLETAPDWFARNGIGVGTLIQTERGGLRETLANRAQLR